MLPLNNIAKNKATNSAKKDFGKGTPSEEKLLSLVTQNYSPNSEQIIVTVIPCGREDGKNSEDEMPYEMKIRKKGNNIIHVSQLSLMLYSEWKQFEGDFHAEA